MLTRDAILAANDLPLEAVDLPEWGGMVYVRTMTGGERDLFELEVTRRPKLGGVTDIRGLKVRLVILTACDEAGAVLFEAGDAEAILGKSARVIDRLFQVAQRLNGLTDEDAEELLGNSPCAPSADSGSD